MMTLRRLTMKSDGVDDDMKIDVEDALDDNNVDDMTYALHDDEPDVDDDVESKIDYNVEGDVWC